VRVGGELPPLVCASYQKLKYTRHQQGEVSGKSSTMFGPVSDEVYELFSLSSPFGENERLEAMTGGLVAAVNTAGPYCTCGAVNLDSGRFLVVPNPFTSTS